MPISSPGCCNVGPLNAETENNLNSILQCGVNGRDRGCKCKVSHKRDGWLVTIYNEDFKIVIAVRRGLHQNIAPQLSTRLTPQSQIKYHRMFAPIFDLNPTRYSNCLILFDGIIFTAAPSCWRLESGMTSTEPDQYVTVSRLGGGLYTSPGWAGLGWAVDWAGLMLIWLSRSWLGSRTANCSPNYLQSRFHHPVMSSWWRPRPHWHHWHCTSRLIVRGPASASHQCSAVQSTPPLDNTFTSTEFVPGYFEVRHYPRHKFGQRGT